MALKLALGELSAKVFKTGASTSQATVQQLSSATEQLSVLYNLLQKFPLNGLNASCLANGLKCKQQTCTNQVEEEKLIKVDNGSTDNKDRESDMDNQRQNSLLLRILLT